MGLQEKVMTEMKAAMKAKDTIALESLRAVKSAILLAKTDKGAGAELSEEDEIKLVQKLVKQRKDSAAIYTEQGREDLAEPELAQVAVIEKFLPEQLTEEEIEKVVVTTIDSIGATGMQDMGKVMGIVSKELAGQADGKTISSIVKTKLSSL
ncbi:MAG: GatB/YqeY domain-containing protein [Algicola sp.]|nr:GatB/YqeY domain-containing protein [Algicola sp.]